MNRTLRINGGELYCYYSPESSGVGNVTDIIPRVTGLFQKYGICREIYRSLPTVYFRFFIQSDVLFLTSDPVVPVVGVVGLHASYAFSGLDHCKDYHWSHEENPYKFCSCTMAAWYSGLLWC